MFRFGSFIQNEIVHTEFIRLIAPNEFGVNDFNCKD
jgi:hypothetical protein